jgi:hypothetical protein
MSARSTPTAPAPAIRRRASLTIAGSLSRPMTLPVPVTPAASAARFTPGPQPASRTVWPGRRSRAESTYSEKRRPWLVAAISAMYEIGSGCGAPSGRQTPLTPRPDTDGWSSRVKRNSTSRIVCGFCRPHGNSCHFTGGLRAFTADCARRSPLLPRGAQGAGGFVRRSAREPFDPEHLCPTRRAHLPDPGGHICLSRRAQLTVRDGARVIRLADCP